MREGHTNQSSTISPLQVKANSLFRNILPPSPFASGFWPYPPHISSPQPIENRDFGWNDAKKDEIYPALGSMLNPDAFEGSTHASPRDFARCKLIEVISFPSSSKGILPMATLEAPVRPRTTSHRGPFVTEPFFDFRNEDNARRMRSAIGKVRGQLGHEYDLIIGGKHIKTTDKIKSLNPTQPSQIVGIHQKAGKEHVEPAMKAALAAFESWSRTTVEERASLVFRVGDLHAPAQDGIHGVAGLRSQQELG